MNNLVTIFGSCRQFPIKQYYQTTDIQDLVTYSHYSKEILQLIRYLKYKNITNEDTRYCFGTNIMNNCSTEINDNLFNFLKTQFDNTTFFLIEIGTRVAYKWKHLYLHGDAIVPKYNFHAIDEIKTYDLTDEEIEDDLIQIKNELHPKPFLLISHFATYSHGKRYELINSLEKICNKLDIPFLNQSIIIEKYGKENIIVDEPVLAHYTEYGKTRIGEILYSKIQEINNNNNMQQET